MGAISTAVGLFGGTFNPIHYGHLRSASQLLGRLQLEQLRLMPCAVPVHRSAPDCSAEHRAAMVDLAVANEPHITCDRRELLRAGKSYTIDSVLELRAELAADRSLCLILGCDALLGLASWHRWRELLGACHVVVIARPGWRLPKAGPVAQWLSDHRLEDRSQVRQTAAGGVLIENLQPQAISSTDIRRKLKAGETVTDLLPGPILDYIQKHDLYK